MIAGDVVKVFDPKLWNWKDVGDNSQFYKEATVLRTYKVDNPREEVADVLFHHDGRISRGHYTYAMKMV